ncbi:phage tail assembly chaperone G [Listeria seeligeri]|uniref:phage tail assembly chaperone G n=1 Tax=Listeria seeligeri TaxID=1640 RepID=UPI0022EBDE68|nr:hypothetical protein [Listeria seeligeri]
MEIILKDSDGKKTDSYKVTRFTLTDWLEATTFQAKQEARFKEIQTLMNTTVENKNDPIIVAEVSKKISLIESESFEDGIKFLCKAYKQKFTSEEVRNGLTLEEYKSVVDQAVRECLGEIETSGKEKK